MFYLTKRTRIEDCKVGERVMVLSDYPGGGIEAGWKGTVDENYGRGISIRWDVTGRCDGFDVEELQFLAFGTKSYVQPMSDLPLDALGRVMRQFWKDEAKHYAEMLDEETGEDIDWDEALAHARAHPDGDHILCAMARIHDWLWPPQLEREPAA
jgi:hypothetical protein